jgi:hypothetical protein
VGRFSRSVVGSTVYVVSGCAIVAHGSASRCPPAIDGRHAATSRRADGPGTPGLGVLSVRQGRHGVLQARGLLRDSGAGHHLVVHKLIGGNRVVDAIGLDERTSRRRDVVAPDATQQAMALDHPQQGAKVGLSSPSVAIDIERGADPGERVDRRAFRRADAAVREPDGKQPK